MQPCSSDTVDGGNTVLAVALFLFYHRDNSRQWSYTAALLDAGRVRVVSVVIAAEYIREEVSSAVVSVIIWD